MGGSGSGRRDRYATKSTTDGEHGLEINWLQREGMLTPGRVSSVTWRRGERVTGTISIHAEESCLTLVYRFRYAGGDWQDVTEVVSLVWTPCHYGGRRPWFVCPRCGQRAGKLYGTTRLFLCRRCCGLVYESQRQGASDRLMRKAHNIQTRLGGEPGAAYPFPEKPKGMHYRTYYTLMQRYYDYVHRMWGAAAKRFGISV